MRGDPREEGLDPGLERIVLGNVVGVPGAPRVHGAVKHHPPYPVAEQRGVDLAQVGAVGVTQVADLLLAKRRPDGVHVPGGVLGGHVRQQPAETVLAAGGVSLGPADEGLLGGLVRRDVVGPRAGEEGRVAVQRGHAGAHAARVEPDDVVFGGHLLVEAEGDRRGKIPPGTARAAGVDQQVTLTLGPRCGCRDHGQRQGDLPARRAGVVQRHGQAGALHRGACDRARLPVQPLRCRWPGGRAPGGLGGVRGRR